MKLVKMTRDMRPFQKDHDALLPDTVAERLVKEGSATNQRDYPATPAEGSKPKTPPPAKRYKTK